MKQQYSNVDDYIQSFPAEVQPLLAEIRRIILMNAPGADESISYQMAAYKTNGRPLVYFAGFPKHIGFYAIPSAHEKFEVELSVYKHGKGSVQFPLSKEIPFGLIADIVKFRFEENKQK